jgi:threonine/homoserine/homoserine lactone efflux protein
MLLKLLESLLIGFSIAAIPGPIFFELVRRTLALGLPGSIALVLGEFTANCILFSLIFLGVSHFLTDPHIRTALYVIGGLILVAVSVGALKLTETDIERSYQHEERGISKKSFLAGFGITISSPIIIALWVSLSGSYLNNLSSQLLAFVNIVFIALGFLLFFIPLAWVVHRIRHKIPPKRVVLLSRIFAIVLICFALLLFRRAIVD